jgi:hypothetical protein
MKKYFFPILILFVFILAINFTSFFLFDNIAISSVATKRWEKIYGLRDWNMPSSAIVDIDGDGNIDDVTYGHCAYLSTVRGETIPKEQRCALPNSTLEETIDKNKIGQSIFLTGSYFADKSFLVLTNTGKWRAYNYGFILPAVEELGQNNLFVKISPSFLDVIDNIYYNVSHVLLPVVFLLVRLVYLPLSFF